MKINNSIFYSYRVILQFGAFLLLAALLPVTQEYLPYFMGLWVLGSVIVIQKYPTIHARINYLAYFPAILFMFTFVSLIYSEDFGQGIGYIEKWLSVSFITLTILFLTKKVILNVHFLFLIFIVSNLLVALYCLTLAGVNSITIDAAGNWYFDPSYYNGLDNFSFVKIVLLRYSHFSGIFFSQIHHPSYFAMYITFIIGVLFLFLHKVGWFKWRVLNVLGILFFGIMIFFLASRAGYITTVVLVVFSFIWFFQNRIKRQYLIIGCMILLSISGFVLMKTLLGENIRQVVALALEEEVPKEKLDARLLLWNVGIDLASEAPLWGYGVGDVQGRLDELYAKRGMEIAFSQHYNVHNQYLSVYLATGIFGLAALLYWFFGSLLLGIRTRNYLLSVFMLIIIINALFENILDRSAGLAFILLFYPILMHQSLQKKRDET